MDWDKIEKALKIVTTIAAAGTAVIRLINELSQLFGG